MIHRTTLGAPLTDEEYNEMQKALNEARRLVAKIPPELEPADLLHCATLIIECGFNLRDKIQRGLNAANQRGAKRHLGGYRHLRVVPKRTVAEDVQADIDAILDFIKPGSPEK